MPQRQQIVCPSGLMLVASRLSRRNRPMDADPIGCPTFRNFGIPLETAAPGAVPLHRARERRARPAAHGMALALHRINMVAPEKMLMCAGASKPWLLTGATMFTGLGIAMGFHAAGVPERWDMGLIAYLHVPATWLALLILPALAVCAVAGRFSREPLCAVLAEALAPTGALFAFLTLWTGSLWGKPVWGTWWNWDLRVIADVVLLAVYVGVFAIHAGLAEPALADRITAMVAIGGAIVVPVLIATVMAGSQSHRDDAPAPVQALSATALSAVTMGLVLYASATVLMRARCIVLERGRDDAWSAAGGRSA